VKTRTTVELEVVSAIDTVLAIRTACDDPLTEVACNDTPPRVRAARAGRRRRRGPIGRRPRRLRRRRRRPTAARRRRDASCAPP
jgi:hypothetical protein